jgi:hypothetical protein
VHAAFRQPLCPAAEDVRHNQLNNGDSQRAMFNDHTLMAAQPTLTRTHFLDRMDRYPESSIEFTM